MKRCVKTSEWVGLKLSIANGLHQGLCQYTMRRRVTGAICHTTNIQRSAQVVTIKSLTVIRDKFSGISEDIQTTRVHPECKMMTGIQASPVPIIFRQL